jgi:hypothetical protein
VFPVIVALLLYDVMSVMEVLTRHVIRFQKNRIEQKRHRSGYRL